MTENKANEILRTKYPQATIHNGKRFGGSNSCHMVVTFEPYGKCYSYYASTYQEVLKKLGFKILYKHNAEAINNQIAELQTYIEQGFKEDVFGLSDEEVHVFTSEEINEMKLKVKELAELIESSCIC